MRGAAVGVIGEGFGGEDFFQRGRGVYCGGNLFQLGIFSFLGGEFLISTGDIILGEEYFFPWWGSVGEYLFRDNKVFLRLARRILIAITDDGIYGGADSSLYLLNALFKTYLCDRYILSV